MPLFPPIDPIPPHVRIARGYREETLTLYLPSVRGEYKDDGDTFDLSPDDLRTWLERVGIEHFDADKILNYVWNFYGCHVDVASGQFVWLPQEELRREFAPPIA